MKEIDKKHAPAVSGGYVGPYVTDPPGDMVPDYPTSPESPYIDESTIGQRDLPSPRK